MLDFVLLPFEIIVFINRYPHLEKVGKMRISNIFLNKFENSLMIDDHKFSVENTA